MLFGFLQQVQQLQERVQQLQLRGH